ncbi:MAG TPA: hypothetical protein VNW26_11130 [Steroidobacteraceae bacterium]|nr:hypothetical protein [Steroidobacteraceae bacterium]
MAGLHGIGVEQSSGHFMQFLEDKIRGHSGAICSVRRHRIVYVGNRQYSRLQQNAIAGQTAWITASVKPFVMLVGDLRDGQWRLEVLKNTVPNGAVRLNQGVLGIGESAWFAKYLRRQSNLANVVDDCGQTKNLKSLWIQTQLRANRDGQLRNAILVLYRVRVPITVGGRKNRDAWTE